jgi:hypothetical protein
MLNGPGDAVMRALIWFATALVGAIVLVAAPARAEMSADAVKQKIEADYAVTVLRVTPMTDDGRPVFAVTIMNPGGAFNEAFQVNTIVIDAETGQPIIQYRQGSGGLRPAAPPVSSRTGPSTASTP